MLKILQDTNGVDVGVQPGQVTEITKVNVPTGQPAQSTIRFSSTAAISVAGTVADVVSALNA